MCEDQAGHLGNFKGVFSGLFFLVRPTEKYQGRAVPGFPEAFHGGHLGGLMFKGVESVKVTKQQLHGGHENGHDHGHAEHHPGVLNMALPPQVECADACRRR